MSFASKLIFSWARASAAALVVTIFVNEKIGGPFKLAGPSMLPTIAAEGEIALVSRIPVATKSLMVGDIVTVKDPEEPGGYLGKRIAGMVRVFSSRLFALLLHLERVTSPPQPHPAWLPRDRPFSLSDVFWPPNDPCSTWARLASWRQPRRISGFAEIWPCLARACGRARRRRRLAT